MPSGAQSEFDLIDWIRRRTPENPRIQLGIGDDCAAIKLLSNECLLTVDQVVEGIHFDLASASPEQIGRKAIARALSDIAAMAALPAAAAASMLLPEKRGMDSAKRIYSGMRTLADEFDAPITGGDVSVGGERLVISVTVIGEPRGERLLTRAGAKPNDIIFVTGDLGGSSAGKHLTFTPRIREAREIVRTLKPTAMIDISDGLAADLGHILKESGVGAIIESEAIPISRAGYKTAAASNSAPLENALYDGEDYELLFCVSEEIAQQAPAALSNGIRLNQIGAITREKNFYLKTGHSERTLKTQGWKHIIE